MSLSEIVKIDCNESGQLTATKNRITFVIPANGEVCNLSKSYINLNMSINGDGTNISASNVSFLNNGALTHDAAGVTLVKNIKMTSALKGPIENIRNCDVLRTTEQLYSLDDQDKINDAHMSLHTPRSKFGFALTPFRDLNVDSVTSRELDHSVRINLKDLLGVGSIPQYDLSKFGRTTIEAELNLDKIASDFSLGASDVAWTFDSKQLGSMSPTAENTTGNTLAETVLMTAKTYEIESWRDEAPFWNGQQLAITRTDKDGTATVTKRVVGVSYNSGNKKVYITMDSAYGTAAATNNSQITAISVVGVNPTTNTLVVNSAELVLEYNADKQSPAQISFMTATTEIDNAGGRQSLNKQYLIEPQAMGVMVCFPAGIISDKAYTSYRISVDNKPLTDREVEFQSPLEYDRKNRYLQNKGKLLNCLREKQLNKTVIPLASEIDAVRYDLVSNAILECVPLTSAMKTLGVEIQSSAAHTLNEIMIFKNMLKTY